MTTATESKTISKTAIAALVFAFLCFPIGIILGVVSIVKIKRSNGRLDGMILAILALILSGAVMLPVTGIAAAVVIPSFMKFGCRAKQAEAKTQLKTAFVGQESYRAEYDTCVDDLSKLEYFPTPPNPRYRFQVLSASDTAFVIEAKATDETLNGDTWTIDQNNQLINVVPGC